tara:strand:+ start:312 stop:737 length:426 start_codon:yes stop_codon:yes gene_type:complete
MNSGELISSFLIDLNRLFKNEVSFEDISFSQVLALISIPGSGVEMSTLSWDLALDNSTVTRLVDRLEKKNLVLRGKSQKDKRLVKVYLTKDGELLQNRIEEKIDFLGNKIESQFSYDKKEDIINNLSSFQWVIKKLFLTKK